MSQLVDGDEVFVMLYKELYFRHLYAKLGPNITLNQRIESWENYTSLFDRVFSDDDDDNNLDRLDLPVQWLWDMVDEFVYQFTDFCRFRSKDLKKRSAADVETLKERTKVWDSMQVLATLNRMVADSEINQKLLEDKQNPEAEALHTALNSEIGIAHVQLVLGYYALVSMCRMHCSCGDYWTALKCIENLDFKGSNSEQVPVYMRVTSCYIALYYYMGFAMMMMRRYTDAVRTMTGVLMYLYRTQHLTRPYQYEQLNKRSEQMYKLIAICINLCPQRAVEDIVMQHLQDKYGDQLARLAKSDEAMYEELFSYAGPKFFYPVCPVSRVLQRAVDALARSRCIGAQQMHWQGAQQMHWQAAWHPASYPIASYPIASYRMLPPSCRRATWAGEKEEGRLLRALPARVMAAKERGLMGRGRAGAPELCGCGKRSQRQGNLADAQPAVERVQGGHGAAAQAPPHSLLPPGPSLPSVNHLVLPACLASCASVCAPARGMGCGRG